MMRNVQLIGQNHQNRSRAAAGSRLLGKNVLYKILSGSGRVPDGDHAVVRANVERFADGNDGEGRHL